MIDYSTSSASEFLHYWTSVSDEEQEDLFLEEDELWDDTEDEDFVKESEPSYHFVGNFFARVLKERTGLQPEQVSQMCSICFENFESEHTKVVLEDCQHVFCVECVKAYFEACGMDIANLKIVVSLSSSLCLSFIFPSLFSLFSLLFSSLFPPLSSLLSLLVLDLRFNSLLQH
eukprot:TRINITY_DN1831_c0_g1_i2.p1 TRINITY_DN1831_c0_g1~~TRINITY_DN1831_c0_g1_i2.p1  ORF type:complete len:173 (+),score=56.70 TRINITY_DN1831_c0_g1_i2:125-643(+)